MLQESSLSFVFDSSVVTLFASLNAFSNSPHSNAGAFLDNICKFEKKKSNKMESLQVDFHIVLYCNELKPIAAWREGNQSKN